MLKNQFTLTTFLILGALIQTLLLALPISRLYTVAPLLLTLGYQAMTTLAVVILPKLGFKLHNPHLNGVVPEKVSAQLPSTAMGGFTDEPSSEPVVVFHLGVQFNHPLGLLAPGAQELAAWFRRMTQDLLANPEQSGYLGSSSWLGMDKAEKNQVMTVFYFRNVKCVHDFAHGPVHRKGWDWYRKIVKELGYKHLGINHELFYVRPGVSQTKL